MTLFNLRYPYWVGYLCAMLAICDSNAQEFKLQVVTEMSPPHQTWLNGEVAGLATDKVRAILNQANVDAQINIYPWARAYNMATTQPNTLIYAIAKTPKREPLFYWLMPITQYKLGLVGRQNTAMTKIKQFSELIGLRGAVQRNDISHEWLLQKGLKEDKDFITCADIGCSWSLLIHKNVDYIIDSPDLISDMAQRLSVPENSVTFVMAIPELEVSAYLAANKDISPHILAKLLAAVKK